MKSLYIKDNIDGFNPQKVLSSNDIAYRNMLAVRDKIECISRYKWEGLEGITSEQLEIMLYQYGSILAAVQDDTLIFTQFCGVGPLNVYGQQETLQPLAFDGKKYGSVKSWVQDKKEVELDTDVGIIINDYSSNFYNIPSQSRQSINNSTTIRDQANTYKLLGIETLTACKKVLANCTNIDQKNNIIKQAYDFLDPDKLVLAVCGGKDIGDTIQVEQLNNTFNPSNFIIAIEYYDKTRKKFNGIPSPENLEKRERMITAECEDMNTATDELLLNGLAERQKACDLINYYFNKNITVTLNTCLQSVDNNNEEVTDQEQEQEEVEQL